MVSVHLNFGIDISTRSLVMLRVSINVLVHVKISAFERRSPPWR